MPTVINTSSFTVTVQASKAGYKTQSTTQTVKVNKANGNLSLSSYSGTITYPNSTSFTVSGTGSISAWSSNTGVATVSVSGNTVTVKSVGAGSATSKAGTTGPCVKGPPLKAEPQVKNKQRETDDQNEFAQDGPHAQVPRR